MVYIFLSILVIFCFYLFLKNKTIKKDLLLSNNKIVSITEKYRGIEDIKKEIEKEEDNLLNIKEEIQEKEKRIEVIKDETEILNKKYDEAISILNDINGEIYCKECGISAIKFKYGTTAEYKDAINVIINKQKELIKNGKAIIHNYGYVINNSQQEGDVFLKNMIQLVLKSFNGECEDIINNVSWNNLKKSVNWVEKSYDKINKLCEQCRLKISEDYKNLKVKEINLIFKKKELEYKNKEEEKEIREKYAEEQRELRKLKEDKERAEREEKHYQELLDKAKEELSIATGIKYDKIAEQIEWYKNQIKEATENKERALSMAQQTRRGYVYIISNIGSFGDRNFKIGMTRRLDPYERIRELSNASVPFKFDVHAMIYSEDAPTLETALHNEFNDERVNKINTKKEFFNISLDEIKNKVIELGYTNTEFIDIPNDFAKEYFESIKN